MQEIVAVDGSRWCRAGTGQWVRTYDANSVVPVADGGTGASALTSNSVLIGNGTNAVKQKATANGAMFATGDGDEPSFGILPIEQGGTGGNSGENALSNLGIKQWLLDNVFKVGYVWMSYTNTSPSGLIGGTWTPITGRFPYFNAGSRTGGANSQTLSIAQMPAHSHKLGLKYGNDWVEDSWNWSVSSSNMFTTDAETESAGGGQPYNNMPAYQTLYAWRRTE